MGKKKVKKKYAKKLQELGIELPKKVKDTCCQKHKKSNKKRCKKCPCFDLLEKVA